MKIKNLFFVATLLIGLLSLNSCSKYEEGPAFTLKTKKARLSREWVADKYIDSDGNETAGNADDGVFEFEKDGSGTITSSGFGIPLEWEFTDSKQNLSFTINFFGSSNTQDWEILKLTSKELWVKDEDGDKTYFKAK